MTDLQAEVDRLNGLLAERDSQVASTPQDNPRMVSGEFTAYPEQELAPAGQRPADPRDRSELESLRSERDAAPSGLSEDERRELEQLRKDRARRERGPVRGDADGVSPPPELDAEGKPVEREHTHTLLLANGQSVTSSGQGGTHHSSEDGTFPIVGAFEMNR